MRNDRIDTVFPPPNTRFFPPILTKVRGPFRKGRYPKITFTSIIVA